MKILITGAAGFLGAATVRLAADRGHHVRAMIRPSSDRSRVGLDKDQLFLADLNQFDLFPQALAGMDAVIHCAAITSEGKPDLERSRKVNVEGTARLFDAARAAGVRRWVQISSMSAHPRCASVYGTTKMAADEYVRKAATPPHWTILRPSLIYGPGGKGLVHKTTEILKKLPRLPILGSGESLLRPVFVTDVADAALRCLELEIAKGKTYMIGGADEVSLNEFMVRLAQAAGHPKPLFHLPLPLCAVMAKVGAALTKNPPFTMDNVLGVKEVQRVDQQAAQQEWDYKPIGLEEGLRRTFGK